MHSDNNIKQCSKTNHKSDENANHLSGYIGNVSQYSVGCVIIQAFIIYFKSKL